MKNEVNEKNVHLVPSILFFHTNEFTLSRINDGNARGNCAVLAAH